MEDDFARGCTCLLLMQNFSLKSTNKQPDASFSSKGESRKYHMLRLFHCECCIKFPLRACDLRAQSIDARQQKVKDALAKVWK
jgi:hypothetical protein